MGPGLGEDDDLAGRGRTAPIDERQGPQPRGCGSPDARRRRRRRRAGRAARAPRPARHARGTTPPGRRRSKTAARSPGQGELARELGIDLVAGSIAERREGHERVANTSVHVGPDGEVKAVYRKIHMFDVEVGGVEYRESEHSEPADEIVLSETAGGVAAGPDHLLRPALSRAVPHPRAARRPRRHRAGELHPGHRPGALGGAAARAGDREPGLRDRPRPGPRPRPRGRQLRQLDDRRPLGRGAGPRRRRGRVVRRRRPRPRRARTRSGRSCRASPTASPAPTAGPRRRGSDGDRRQAGRGRQAPPDPRRGRARVRQARLPPLPRVGRRRRGGRGLRPRLPLLPLQGGDPQHALPRALADHARRDRRDRLARPARPARSSTRSPRSSSTPTATTPT